MDFGKIILIIMLIPIIIASSIAIMAISYMLVPVAIVAFIGTIAYIIVQANSKE